MVAGVWDDLSLTNPNRTKTKTMKTVSDIRTEKAHANGDYVAYAKDQAAIRFAKARTAYLKANPEVGILMRNGAEIFYRNLEPYHLGLTKEFYPSSVIHS